MSGTQLQNPFLETEKEVSIGAREHSLFLWYQVGGWVPQGQMIKCPLTYTFQCTCPTMLRVTLRRRKGKELIVPAQCQDPAKPQKAQMLGESVQHSTWLESGCFSDIPDRFLLELPSDWFKVRLMAPHWGHGRNRLEIIGMLTPAHGMSPHGWTHWASLCSVATACFILDFDGLICAFVSRGGQVGCVNPQILSRLGLV